MKKNGQMNHVSEIIIILACAIVLFLFLATKVTSNAKSMEESINTCRFSVMAQASTELQPGIREKKSPFDINCNRRYVLFQNTKVELGLSPENLNIRPIIIDGKEVSRFKTLTSYYVNQVVAEEMRICWYQFGEGKLKVFVNDDKNAGSQDDVCFICSEINFNHENINTANFNGLVDYMNRTKFNTDNTYLSFMNNKGSSEVSWLEYHSNPKNLMRVGNDFNMTPINTYFVVFLKENYAGPNRYVVGISTPEEINKFCDKQP